MPCSVDRFSAVAAFGAGSPTRWCDLNIGEDALLELCRAEDLSALCFHRLSRAAVKSDWPPRLFEMLSEAARVQAGEELLRGAETRAVLGALATAGIRALLL